MTETGPTADFAIAMPARFLEKGKVAPTTPELVAEWLAELPAQAVPLPPMCDRHADELERETAKALGGALLAPYMVTTMLLFQVAAADPELWRQAETYPELGRILTLGGCHACRYPRAFRAAFRLIRRRGLHAAAALSKNEATSANWRPDVFAVDRR